MREQPIDSGRQRSMVSMGIEETFGNRNRMERWFRELKDRTKEFHNNVNARTEKCVEELVSAIALLHNIIKVDGV